MYVDPDEVPLGRVRVVVRDALRRVDAGMVDIGDAPERRYDDRALPENGALSHDPDGRAEVRAAGEHVRADVERVSIDPERRVVGKRARIAVGRRPDRVLLKLEEREARSRDDGRAVAHRNEHPIRETDRDDRHEPSVRRSIEPDAGIARVGRPANRVEERIGRRIERAELAVLLEDLDAAVDDDENLGRSDCTHRVWRNESGLPDLRAKKARPDGQVVPARRYYLLTRRRRPRRDARRVGIER